MSSIRDAYARNGVSDLLQVAQVPPQMRHRIMLTLEPRLPDETPAGAVFRLSRLGLGLAVGRIPSDDEIARAFLSLAYLAKLAAGHPGPKEVRRLARLGKASGLSAYIAGRLAGP